MQIELIRGDITSLRVEAIVNAANSRLQHGAGVAGALVRAGGEKIQEESDEIGFVPVGSAVATSGGNLLCRYIIHAVGPRMGEGDEDAKLRSATIAALDRGEELCVKSIAFPAISTGIFGFPMERCADIMLRAVVDFERRAHHIERVYFCLFGAPAYEIFERAWETIRNGQ